MEQHERCINKPAENLISSCNAYHDKLCESLCMNNSGHNVSATHNVPWLALSFRGKIKKMI